MRPEDKNQHNTSWRIEYRSKLRGQIYRVSPTGWGRGWIWAKRTRSDADLEKKWICIDIFIYIQVTDWFYFIERDKRQQPASVTKSWVKWVDEIEYQRFQ